MFFCILLPLHTVSLSNQQTSKRLLLFYKPSAAQQSAGSIHTNSELLACSHRSLALQTDRTYASTHPSDRQCEISGGYRTLLIRHRSCRSAFAEQRRTPRALRMQLSRCRMTAYRMTAPSAPKCCTLSHSNLPISSQDGSDRQDLMENPGLTFKLILTDTLCSGI